MLIKLHLSQYNFLRAHKSMMLYCAEKKISSLAKVFLTSVDVAGHAKTCVFSFSLLTLRMFVNSVHNRVAHRCNNSSGFSEQI